MLMWTANDCVDQNWNGLDPKNIPSASLRSAMRIAEIFQKIPRGCIIGPGDSVTWKVPTFNAAVGPLMAILLQSNKLLFRGTKVYNGLEHRYQFHFSAKWCNVERMMGLIMGAVMIGDCYQSLVKHPIEYPCKMDKEWHERKAADPWVQSSKVLEQA